MCSFHRSSSDTRRSEEVRRDAIRRERSFRIRRHLSVDEPGDSSTATASTAQVLLVLGGWGGSEGGARGTEGRGVEVGERGGGDGSGGGGRKCWRGKRGNSLEAGPAMSEFHIGGSVTGRIVMQASQNPTQDVLPAGWTMSTAQGGRVFFIDHNSRTTTWVSTTWESCSPSDYTGGVENQLFVFFSSTILDAVPLPRRTGRVPPG